MSAQTNISWCDSTFNPWMGCTKVSPACDHCYAERDTKRFGRVEWGAGKPRVRTGAENWGRPKKWNDKGFVQCTACGWRGQPWNGSVFAHNFCDQPGCGGRLEPARRRVFCASLADWLDNEVPIEWLVDLLGLIRRTPNLDWLLLTKRIGNWRNRLCHASRVSTAQGNYELTQWLVDWLDGAAPHNVWIGSTAESQGVLDRDLSKLYAVPATIRFISAEPLLSALSFAAWPLFGPTGERLLHWVIAGGESGAQARPMSPDWVRGLRDQCAKSSVAFHFKQWGEWLPMLGQEEGVPVREKATTPDGWVVGRAGTSAAGRRLDGIEHNGFPEPTCAR